MATGNLGEGTGKGYWLPVAVLIGFALFGATLAFFDAKGREIGVAAALMFGSLAALFSAWPYLRTWERRQGREVIVEAARHRGRTFPAFRFPGSRMKVAMFALIFVIIAVVGGLLLFRALQEGPKKWNWSLYGLNPVNSGLMLTISLGLVARSLYDLARDRLGVSLTPEGVLWSEMLLPTVLIPWERVENAAAFVSSSKGGDTERQETFGLRVREQFDKSDPLLSQRKRFLENRRKQGWDLYLFAESLAVPPIHIAFAVNAYRNAPPSHRAAVGTPAEAERLRELLAEAPPALPPMPTGKSAKEASSDSFEI